MIQNTKYEGQNTEFGFTLVELLITIFLVSVGLIGVLSFFNSTLSSQFDAKNEVIAAGLAQEGSELVRNLVEYKRLQPTNNDFTTVAKAMAGCNRIDYRSLTTHSCQSGDYAYFNGSQYQQNTSGDFKRSVLISCRDASENNVTCSSAPVIKSLKIVSTVSWNNDSRNTTATDIIYENTY